MQNFQVCQIKELLGKIALSKVTLVPISVFYKNN